MKSRKKLIENSQIIIDRANRLLRRNKRSSKILLQHLREQKSEIPSTDELDNVSWVLKNKLIPMVSKMKELEKDLNNLSSYPIGKYPIEKKEQVEEGDDIRVSQFDKEPTYQTWTEPPQGKRDQPLKFMKWTFYVLGNDLAKRILLRVYNQKYPNDFVWIKENPTKQETYVYILSHTDGRNKDLFTNSKTPISGKRRKLTEREIPIYYLDQRSDEKLPTKDSRGNTLKRVDTFKDEPDDKKEKDVYPFGRYRGVSTHYYEYVWNQLGTETGQKELIHRYLKGLPEVQPFGNHTNVSLKEYPDDNKTIVYKTIHHDSSD